MLDAAVLFFSLCALRRVLALRWRPGVALALLTFGAWSWVAVAGWREHALERFDVFRGLLMMLFFGPTTAGTGGAPVMALATAAALTGFVLANREASRTPPMRESYRQWSDTALAFLAPLLLTLAPQSLFALACLLG